MVLEHSNEKCLSDENFIAYDTTSPYSVQHSQAQPSPQETLWFWNHKEKIPMAP